MSAAARTPVRCMAGGWTARALAGVAAILGAVGLSGCASLSEDECRRADWGAIGQRDGAAGAGPDRLSAHAKACAKVGVVPDEALWQRGREAGLMSYCTGTNGRDVGARGMGYGGVCVGPNELEFMRGYEVGRQIHALDGVLASNRAEQRRLIDRLAAQGVGDDEKRSIRQRLTQLDFDADRVRRSIERAWRLPL